MAVEASLPWDPLGGRGEPAQVDVLIPCGPRDVPVVHLTVAGARSALGSQLGRLRILAPAADCPALRAGLADPSVEIVSDDVSPAAALLGSLLDPERSRVPAARRGWVAQQVLKLGVIALDPAARPTLVLDADTVLLRPRTWLVDGRQVLSISHEFTAEYAEHAHRCLPAAAPQPFSFVTHHQLWQPDLLRTMLAAAAAPTGSSGDGSPAELAAGITTWVAAGRWDGTASAISEYHTYGTWLLSARPDRAVLAGWRNTAASRAVLGPLLGGQPPGRPPEAVLHQLRGWFPDAGSVSFHAYLGG